MKNIIFNVCGSNSKGTGHTKRQITFYLYLLNNNIIKKTTSLFVTKNTETVCINILKKNLIKCFIYEDENELLNFLKNKNYNIIINDILDTEYDFIKKLKEFKYFVVNFEDKGSGCILADLVINDMYNNSDNDNINTYCGNNYSVLRNDIHWFNPIIENEVKNIIISFGGTDPKNYTEKVIELLINNKINENIIINVILGIGYINKNIYKFKDIKNINIFQDIENLPYLIQDADIGITSNGRTLMEFCYLNVPCLSIPQNEREKEHPFACLDNGIIYIENYDSNKIIDSINKLIQNKDYRMELINYMNKKKEELINGKENIINLINKNYKYIDVDIFLQCRINSSRLAKKATRILYNKKMIEHQIERLKRCKNINNIILCTSTNTENNILIEIANSMGIKHYRGSEDNVLERFYNCAINFNSKNIIRCTGDCPLIDSSLIDLLSENFFEKNINHLNFRNGDITRNNNFPDGFDAEIFTFEVLEEAYKNDNSDFGKEHVTPYIVKKYGTNFCVIPNVEEYNLDNFHYSVDTEEDFKKIEEIYNDLYPKNDKFSLYDILNYLNNKKYEIVDKCPLCNNENSNKFSIKHDNIILLECTKCNLIYNNKIVKNDVFYKQYQNYHNNRNTNIIELSTYSNRKKQYLLDYNFIKKHVSIENKKILDFGCGTGEFLDMFDSNNKYGIEIDLTYTNIFTKKNIIKKDYINEYFDIIIFRGTFQYIRNLNEIICSIKEFLNYGGYLIILQTPNKNCPLFNLLKDNWSLCNKKEFLHYWSIDSLKNIFTDYEEISYEYPYKETPYYNKNDINKLIESYVNNKKIPFAFYDNMFNLILKKPNLNNSKEKMKDYNSKFLLTQQQYLKILPNEYDKEDIVFDNIDFKNNNIEIVKGMVDLYNRMNNNASGDWKWISDNKVNIDQLFETNNYNEIENLYSNFARNFISFGIISNGVYEKLIKDQNMIIQLKQNILNDIDSCIELCDITSINVLNTPRIGNFYGIVKNHIFITPDNIRHYYSAFKINNFLFKEKNPTIMEIGAGYGGLLVNLLKSREDKFCYINVDIKNTLLVFYYYIRSYIEIEKLDKKIFFSENGNVTNEIIREFDIILIPSDKHQNITGKIDLVFNSHSLSEMSQEHMTEYFETIDKLNIKHIFHVNSIYFPWKTSDRGHIQISTKDFPIDKNKYIKIYHNISPWMAGSGRYREYYYKLITNFL